MTQLKTLHRVGVTTLFAASLAVSLPAQQPAAGTSVAKAAEFVALLQAKKLEAFAMKDTRDPAKTDRYIAALVIPNAQIIVVAATYTRFMDVEYRLHNKDFREAYRDLNTSVYSQDKFVIEDVLANGLVAMPKRNAAADTVRIGTAELTFNGEFADPRRRRPEDKKISQEDYMKRFSEADQRYSGLLDLMIEQLKKAAPPTPGGLQ
jgi:hypothetical protein